MNIPDRIGKNGNAPGKYELVSRIHNSVVDPGGTVFIEFFISGYGQIDASKLAFYPPTDNLLTPESSITSGFLYNESTYMLTWGRNSIPLTNTGFVLQVDAMRRTPDGKQATTFFDARSPDYQHDPVPRIITETALGENTIMGLPSQFRAPFVLRLKISDTARPGTYFTSAVFTYFDGERWQISSIQPAFTVRTIFQRREGIISKLGIVAALGSGSALVLLAKDIIIGLIKLFK